MRLSLAVTVVVVLYLATVAVGQVIPSEISQRMSTIPSFSDADAGSATNPTADPAKGSGFRPQGTSGRGISRGDAFGEQVRASRGLSGVEDPASRAAISSRASAARQQLRARRQQQQLLLGRSQSTTAFRDPRHEINFTLSLSDDVAVPAAPPAAKATELRSRYDLLHERLPIENLTIEVRDRTAVLTGQTATESTRRLATRLALLEPGIRDVENRIVVPAR